MFKFEVVVADRSEAEFLANSVIGVATTNGIKLGEPLLMASIVEFEPPVVLFTKEQREQVMSKVDLAGYASVAICGDGLEIDRASQDFEEMSDADVVLNGVLQRYCLDVGDLGWEQAIQDELGFLPPEVVGELIKELAKCAS